MATSKVGGVLAKALGIDPDAGTRQQPADLHEITTKAIEPYEPFFEEDPTVKEWIKEQMPTKQGAVRYAKSIFPFTNWIGRYNTRWLIGDAIAGVTLGLVVVPQAMAYALLAHLPPEYGLYTSFTGAALYWLFGTSKDIAIGATAVVSLLIGKVINKVLEEHPGEFAPEEISKCLAFLAGAVLLVFGLLRLDWIVEFIPHVSISAFVTAASITITLSQVPALLGIDGVNSKGAAYEVFINTAKGLPRIKLDAAVGLTALALLSLIKWYCDRMFLRQPHRARMWSMICSLRMTFVILLYTFISFLVNRDLPTSETKFRITGQLPTGFTHAGPPSLKPKLIMALLPDLPATIIILVIEHIAIGKSFGRTNNYTVVPSQELIAIGCTNLFGPFLGAYASTGSFGGTAILSKAGVRTPMAGIFNGIILLLALYALTSVLYFIPMASLAALIIHAVINLVTSPEHIFKSWLMSPPDVFIYFVGVFVSIFTSLEAGIYATVALSAILLLLRLARAKGRLLGRVHIHQDPQDKSHGNEELISIASSLTLSHSPSSLSSRDVFLPLDRQDGTNPNVEIENLYPGVFVYRFSEGFTYLNQAQYVDRLVEYITKQTQQTSAMEYEHPGDRPWNEPAPTKPSKDHESLPCEKPVLRAVVLDCSAVNNMDSGAVEALIDLRSQLDRWAAPDPVEWHFASVHNRWTRRALAVAGFGYPSSKLLAGMNSWQPIFSLAELENRKFSSNTDLKKPKPTAIGLSNTYRPACLEEGRAGGFSDAPLQNLGSLDGVNRPFFHIDLATAVENAVKNAVSKDHGHHC